MFDAIVVDLDGTIVDCSARHHAAYADVCREQGLPALPLDEYWEMKRRRAPWGEIFLRAGAATEKAGIDRFEAGFLGSIEDPAYLRLDTLYDDAVTALTRVKMITSALVLVSMRRQRKHMNRQIADLGIEHLFDRVSCLGDNRSVSKAAIALGELPEQRGQLAWIGDTEEDISGARTVGALACALHRGLREMAYLEEHRPDLLVGNLSDLLPELTARASVAGKQ